MPKKITELPYGAKIKFGAYCVEDEGAHVIKWIKAQDNDTIFITEKIEDFRAFDAKEQSNPDEYRRRYGNNRYSVSNIDGFLNSSGEHWYVPRHEYDEAPTGSLVRDNTEYAEHQGFLAFFAEWELEAIMNSQITVTIPSCDRYGQRYEVITRKVFLPSMMNVFGRTTSDIEEGEYWDYFRNYSAEAQPTRFAVDNTDMDDGDPEEDENWYWLLRSPSAGDSYGVRYVDRGGDYDYCDACDGMLGVRPALRINPEILVSDKPDDDGYYEIIQKDVEICEVSEDELMKLLLA